MTLTSSIKGTLGPIALVSAFSMLFLGPSASNASTSEPVDITVGIETACDETQIVALGFAPVWVDSGLGVMLDPGGIAQATYVDFDIDNPVDCYGVSGGYGQVEFSETGFLDVVALANSEDVTRETGITTTFECENSDTNLTTPVFSASKYTCSEAGASPTSIKLSISADGTVAQNYYKNTLSLTLLPASD
jgi:hypothetical protein